jgi:hypothetical protein
VIQPGDQWENLNDQGQNWTFWSAFSDQGLLYDWTKVRRLLRVEELNPRTSSLAGIHTKHGIVKLFARTIKDAVLYVSLATAMLF